MNIKDNSTNQAIKILKEVDKIKNDMRCPVSDIIYPKKLVVKELS